MLVHSYDVIKTTDASTYDVMSMTIFNDTIRQHSNGSRTLDGGWVSDFVRYLFEVVVFTFLCGSISAVGIVANVINIVVFVRQGVLSDSSNVSLLGLAVSDLCSLISLLWLSICMAILFKEPPDMNWEPHGISFVTAGIPHVIFAQITCWITAFVAFERCMCVVFPFKMRTIFTAKRSAVIIPLLFVYNFTCFLPVFITHRLQWEVTPATNETKLILHFTDLFDKAQVISNYTNSFFNRLFPIAVVIICTRVTTLKVNSSKKFRKTMTQVTNSHASSVVKPNEAEKTNPTHSGKPTPQQHPPNTSQKEVRLVRMITTICIIYLVCYCPDIFMAFFRGAVPEIKHLGTYHNLFHVFYSTGFFLESVNSSLNIIVYYKLSTRYRQELRRWLGLQEKSKRVK